MSIAEIQPVPIDVVMPEHAGGMPVLPLAVRRVVACGAMVTGLAGVAACGPDNDGKPAEAADTLPAHVLVEQGLAYTEFNGKLLATPPDIDGARKLIPGLSNGDQKVTTLANQAADLTFIDGILTGVQGSDPKDQSGALAQIADPSLRAQTAQTVYVFRAGKWVKDAGNTYSHYTPEQARTDLDKALPAGADAIRADAEVALDVSVAKNIVNSFSTGSLKEADARAQLAKIGSAQVRGLALRALDDFDAADLLEMLYINRITAAEARADAADISDPNIRQRALNGIKVLERDPYGEYESGQTDLSLAGYDTESKLDGLDDAFEHDQDNARDTVNKNRLAKYETLDAVEAAIGEQAVANNAITSPSELMGLKPLADPLETVDLTNIKGTKTVKNSCVAANKGDSDAQENCGDPELHQFGEIYAENGQLKVNLDAASGITDAQRKQFDTVIERNRPFLEAAFASGQVVTVRFIIAKDFDPAFYGPTRELFMTLANNDDMSMDQFSGAMTHELMHALMRDFFANLGTTDAQVARLQSVCNNLRRSAYNDFETTLEYGHPEWLQQLLEKAKPEHKALVQRVIQAVHDGDLEDILAMSNQQLKDSFATPNTNQCENVGEASASTDILYNARDDIKDGYKISFDDLKYLFTSDPYSAMAKSWKDMIRYTSVYNKIDDHSYIDTNSPDKQYLGHGEDNANEAGASLLNGGIAHTDTFVKGLKTLDPEEFQAAKDAEVMYLDWMIQKYPSLAKNLTALRNYFAGLKQR